MSTDLIPTTIINIGKEEEQAHNTFHERANDLVASLPKVKGWRGPEIFLHKGFWLTNTEIKSSIMIQEYFNPKPTDIFLAAFMKCGTTWLKALMFAIANRHLYNSNSDVHPLHRTGPQGAFPYIDAHILLDYPVSKFDHLPSPRLFATHFPHALFPTSMTSLTSSCKFVYVCRDPKDALISKWHFMNKLRSKELAPLPFNEAYEMFCNGVSEFGPFWEHVLGYWKASKEAPEKILFLKYEDMKREPKMEVKKLGEFMGMGFSDEEIERGVVEEIVKLCSFENLTSLEVNKEGGGVQKFTGELMVKNEDYFRKGKVGDWKNYLTKEMSERIDSITESKLKGSGLTLGLTI